MKLHLDQADLYKAVRLFIENEGISLSDRELDINLTAGRSQGHYAEVTIDKPEETETSDPFADSGTEAAPKLDPDDSAIVFDD